ncbi:MAG: YceG family protein [Lachnospiraceae bacterium]|nr:YceG family protein [Lachnospiraceae bacterium]
MFEHRKADNWEDYFRELKDRPRKCVYFGRLNAYSIEVGDFVRRYYEEARRCGVIIEGRIPNPDENNLSYYEEIMGMGFAMTPGFFFDSLKKWLPRLSDRPRKDVAEAIYDALTSLKKAGKNENILKNAYIKFMCWLYYRFERVLSELGREKVPKILYEGEVSSYELYILSILSRCGSDVVLLQRNGDQAYLKLDPLSTISDNMAVSNGGPFPADFNIKKIQQEMKEASRAQRLYGPLPRIQNCTNAWIQGNNVLDDIRKPPADRGSDGNLFYNCFIRMNGVEDKLTYVSDLFRLYQELKQVGRNTVAVDAPIPIATTGEISQIQRKGPYKDREALLLDLKGNIRNTYGSELQRLMTKAFLDLMIEESEREGMNLNRLLNKGVGLLCWMNRYLPELFSKWEPPAISCFIHLGGCKKGSEAMFLRFLSRLPVDVITLTPNRNENCVLEDKWLFEKNYSDSLIVEKFPRETPDLRVGTSAYHAERELDTLLYQDSGMYRNQQFGKANALNLRTMYEEIAILWKEEVRFRPNFSTAGGVVNVPVICAKVCGVKDGDVDAYWNGIQDLMGEDVYLISRAPFIVPGSANPMKAIAPDFLKNGRLQRRKLREHRDYPFGYLREEIQEHILDKMELLLDQRLIKGTFENGTEFTVIATILNMEKELIRSLQKFDFTKKNPKLIYIIPGENVISLEDSILTAFLSLAGFDVVFYVPTGYQSVEKYFNRLLIEEHEIGEYMYDLNVPALKAGEPSKGKGIFGWLFGKK